MNDFFHTAKVTNTYRPDNPRAAKLARQYPGLVKVRRYTDDSGEVKKTIELEVIEMRNFKTQVATVETDAHSVAVYTDTQGDALAIMAGNSGLIQFDGDRQEADMAERIKSFGNVQEIKIFHPDWEYLKRFI